MIPEDYVPAAGRKGLTGFYDFGMAITMREAAWRPVLLDRLRSGISNVSPVIDVGAGTGTFALMIADAMPGVPVIAIDGDPDILKIAENKGGAGRVDFRQGLATNLEVPDQSAQAVTISLVLHHLGPEEKSLALAEAMRVLEPDGQLLIADWGRPSLVTRPGFTALRMLDGFENTKAHSRGEIQTAVSDCGFKRVQTFQRTGTVWGSLELIEARR